MNRCILHSKHVWSHTMFRMILMLNIVGCIFGDSSNSVQKDNELFFFEIVTIVVSVILAICVLSASFIVLRFRLIRRIRMILTGPPETMLSQRQVPRLVEVSSSTSSSHTEETLSCIVSEFDEDIDTTDTSDYTITIIEETVEQIDQGLCEDDTSDLTEQGSYYRKNRPDNHVSRVAIPILQNRQEFVVSANIYT